MILETCEKCNKRSLETLDYKDKKLCAGCFKEIKKAVGEGELERNGTQSIVNSIGPSKFKQLYGIDLEATKVFSRKGQAEKFSEMQPYFYDRIGMFWLWNSKLFKWDMVDETDLLNMVVEMTGRDVITSKARTEIINSMKQEGRLRIPKNLDKNFVQFKDKIYDITTCESFEATPQVFSTNPIPYSISHDPSTPTFDKLFDQWVGEENREKLYEIIAYCMLIDYPLHRIFCLFGEGLNGKGCFLRILSKFIGSSNICSTDLEVLAGSRFEAAKLHKKLVCQIGETNISEIKKTSILKRLSGQDMIGLEYKNKMPFDEVNYAKLLIATNSLPPCPDKTIGWYRRWMIIDFPNRFTETKDVLSEVPEEEYSNLATKCLMVLKTLLERRKFTNEGTIEERMKRYEDKSDYVSKFFKDNIETEVNGHITKRKLKDKFDEWCYANKYRILTDIAFSKKVKEKDIEDGLKYFDFMFDGKGGNARVWFGIKLREI